RRKPPGQVRLAVTVAAIAVLVPTLALLLFMRTNKRTPSSSNEPSVAAMGPKLASAARAETPSKPVVEEVDNPARWAKSLHLLPPVNIEKDRERGAGKFQNGELVAEPAEQTSLYLPYRPPAEYDFRIVFSTPEFNWVSHSGGRDGRVIEWSMAGNENWARLG